MSHLDPNKILNQLFNWDADTGLAVAGFEFTKHYTGEFTLTVLIPALLTREQLMRLSVLPLRLQNFYHIQGDMVATEVVFIVTREHNGESLVKQLLGLQTC
jgi:hypothetical protein